MSLYLANAFGFVVAHWKWFALGGGLLLIFVIFGVRSCGLRPPAKLNEAEVQRGEQAIKEQNKAELVEILTTAEVREKAIDANVANAKADTVNAVYEAKKKYSEMEIEELRRQFEAGKSEPEFHRRDAETQRFK